MMMMAVKLQKNIGKLRTLLQIATNKVRQLDVNSQDKFSCKTVAVSEVRPFRAGASVRMCSV